MIKNPNSDFFNLWNLKYEILEMGTETYLYMSIGEYRYASDQKLVPKSPENRILNRPTNVLETFVSLSLFETRPGERLNK